MVAPMELQMTQLAFPPAAGDDLADVLAHIELAQMIASAPEDDDLAELAESIDTVATHVSEKEQWFSEYLGNLRREVESAAGNETLRERRAAVRSYVNSPEARHDDAIALVTRTYHKRGLALPVQIPESLIQRVALASCTSCLAVGVLLERIVCEGANLDKPKIRNLLWDQEIAGNLGQQIEGLPIVVVTADGFFAEAARRAGHAWAVKSPLEYASVLGVTLTSLR